MGRAFGWRRRTPKADFSCDIAIWKFGLKAALRRRGSISAAKLRVASAGQWPVPTPKPSLIERAANGRNEPEAAIDTSRCARSQHKKCGMSERFGAAAQRKKRPFVQTAAWIRRRIYKSRGKEPFCCGCANDGIRERFFDAARV